MFIKDVMYMKEFSISQVEFFSQIKAGTLRVWEKRYGICKPVRSNGKNRRYNLSELELILNIGLLNKNGYKVSKLAELDAEVIREKAASLTHVEDLYQHAINLLILYKFSIDIEGFEFLLDHCIRYYGADNTLKRILIPFLEKVNLLSYNSTSNEVHLVTSSVRKKILACTENVKPLVKINKSAVLFLPEGEHFDLLLLYMTYLVKSAGLNTIYLGTNISEDNIISLVKQKNPDYIFTYLKPQSKLQMPNLISHLQNASPDKKLKVVTTDSFTEQEAEDDNAVYIHYKDFEKIFQSV